MISQRKFDTLSDTDDGDVVNAHLPDLNYVPNKVRDKSEASTSRELNPSMITTPGKKDMRTTPSKGKLTPYKHLQEKVSHVEVISGTESVESPLAAGKN